jgi:toxin CcdB
MARFDVHRPASGGFLLDCQADVLNGLNTRFVVPLLPPEIAPLAGERLNPSFTVAGETVVMVTQFASSITLRQLGPRVESLAKEQPAIMNAIDMLLTGY